jgi:hypothetical protein
VTGTVSPSGVGLTIQASGTITGLSCDTGALSLTLDHFTGGPD